MSLSNFFPLSRSASLSHAAVAANKMTAKYKKLSYHKETALQRFAVTQLSGRYFDNNLACVYLLILPVTCSCSPSMVTRVRLAVCQHCNCPTVVWGHSCWKLLQKIPTNLISPEIRVWGLQFPCTQLYLCSFNCMTMKITTYHTVYLQGWH